MKNRTSTTTSQKVTTRRALQDAIARTDLLREEELVLRMRHGIAAPKSTILEYRGQDEPELAAKLAFMEAGLLARAEEPTPTDGEDEVKQAIIDRLRRL